MEQEYIYKFTPEERQVILNRFQLYAAAVQVVAELHGLPSLGVPLNTDPGNNGFICPEGLQVTPVDSPAEQKDMTK